MHQKKVFKILFVGLAMLLLLLPLVLSLQDMLTKLLLWTGWYDWIQTTIVPYEIHMVGILLELLGITFRPGYYGVFANGIYANISWNCLGWQSLVFFMASLPFGLMGGKYTYLTVIEAIVIGLTGTFLINLLRMTFTIVLLVISRPLFVLVFHDYVAAIVTVCWLFIYWSFSYKYVLESKNEKKNIS